MSACEDCLRRARLVELLAPHISGLLGRRGARRPKRLLSLPEDELLSVAGGTRAGEVAEGLERFDPREAVESAARAGVDPVCRHDTRFPAGLLALDDPPAVLFCAGRTELLAGLSESDCCGITVVGTRRASPYGLEMAHALGRGLGAAGVPVVSGLALGIDAAVHRGCLEAGGPPVAVLAGGPDLPYPRRHARLHAEIRAGGLVVSELPPGARPFRWSFPARNRIMAGLGRMTVVVEAAEASGSLITATAATQIGRTVGAVPGRATSRRAAGSNQLLREGAAVIRSPADVLEELFGAGWKPQEASEPDDPRLRSVLEAVEQELTPAAIAERTGLSASEVRTALARLEGEGFVKPDGLGSFVRLAR